MNVCSYESPFLRLPDEKSVPVTVCVTESIFVHFTVSPGDIVIELGIKAKPWIVTSIDLPPAETAGLSDEFVAMGVSAEFAVVGVSDEVAVVGVSAGVAAGFSLEVVRHYYLCILLQEIH